LSEKYRKYAIVDKRLTDDDIAYIAKMEDSRREPGDDSDYVINVYDMRTQEPALLDVPYHKVPAHLAEASGSGSDRSASDASEPDEGKVVKRPRGGALATQRKKLKTSSPNGLGTVISGAIDTSVARCFRREIPATLEPVIKSFRNEILKEFEKALNPLQRAVEGLQRPQQEDSSKADAEEVRKGCTVRPTGKRSCEVTADESDVLQFLDNLRESSTLVPCRGKRVGIKKDLGVLWQEYMAGKDENYQHMGKDQLRNQLRNLIVLAKDERHGDLDAEHPVFSFNQKKNAGLTDWDISKS
jgi:hypothetical protein